jgi:hypothetical protein
MERIPAVIAFLKFVFGPMPVWRHFRYQSDGRHWCPRRLEWTMNLAPPELELYPKIWIRRARRWFQGKRDHQVP